MSGRRGHHRFTIRSSANGAVRVLRDVVIERMEREELMVISQTPALIGEEMSLELFSGSGRVALTVTALESRPVVINGSVRHLLRVVETPTVQRAQSNREALADSPVKPEID